MLSRVKTQADTTIGLCISQRVTTDDERETLRAALQRSLETKLPGQTVAVFLYVPKPDRGSRVMRSFVGTAPTGTHKKVVEAMGISLPHLINAVPKRISPQVKVDEGHVDFYLQAA